MEAHVRSTDSATAEQPHHARPRLRIIDSDVHPILPAPDLGPVLPYMSAAWRRRFEMKGQSLGAVAVTPRFMHPTGNLLRRDTRTQFGAGGSDPAVMRVDLLDRFGIDCAILNNFQVATLAVSLAGPDESVALCAAFNDYFLSEWVSQESRFSYTLTVPTQDPEAAAEEIRRRGSATGVAAIFMPLLNIRMGNRHYFPIYRAAEEAGLPIFVHFSGADFIYQGAPVAHGLPEGFSERYVDLSNLAIPNVASLVFSGVFERFRSLKFVFAEYGFSWMVPLIWRMDRVWSAARLDTPWVKKRPGEYVRERIRLTTQPVDEPEAPKQIYTMLEMLGTDMLLFSTDYPHWDNDMPDQVLRGLRGDTRERVFGGNAADVFRIG